MELVIVRKNVINKIERITDKYPYYASMNKGMAMLDISNLTDKELDILNRYIRYVEYKLERLPLYRKIFTF